MEASARAILNPAAIGELARAIGDVSLLYQSMRDEIPTVWIGREHLRAALRYLKCDANRPYRMLYDLTAIDERVRSQRENLPESDFTVIYHLLSFGRNEDIRVKVALRDGDLRHRALRTCGRRLTGTSARSGTCSASSLMATRI
jgi:NADH-quinone oxidoreductase subunit C/D